jgi:hypothetical protein
MPDKTGKTRSRLVALNPVAGLFPNLELAITFVTFSEAWTAQMLSQWKHRS